MRHEKAKMEWGKSDAMNQPPAVNETNDFNPPLLASHHIGEYRAGSGVDLSSVAVECHSELTRCCHRDLTRLVVMLCSS